MTEIPPPGARSRRFTLWRNATFVTLLVGYIGYYLCRANLSAATPLLREELHLDLVEMGWVSSVSTMIYGVGKFSHSFLAQLLGGRIMFLIGLGGAVVFCGTCGLVDGLWGLLTLWSLNRFAQAGGWVGMVQIAAQWFPRHRIGTVMSILSLSWLAGDWFARELAGAVVGAGLGWRMVFVVPAGIVAVMALVALVTLKGAPELIGEAPLSHHEAGPPRREGFDWEAVAGLLKNPQFHVLAGMSVVLTAIRQAALDWSSTHFASLGLSPAEAMTASAVIPQAGIAGTLFAGFASDYLWKGRRAPVALLLLGLLCLGLVLLARATALDVTDARLLWGLCGFGLYGPYSLLGGAGSVDVGGRRAAAVAAGLLDGIGYLVGAFLGGVGTAAAVQYLGWSTAFGLMAGGAGLAIIGAWRLTRS